MDKIDKVDLRFLNYFSPTLTEASLTDVVLFLLLLFTKENFYPKPEQLYWLQWGELTLNWEIQIFPTPKME
jgi:hypothetical protein